MAQAKFNWAAAADVGLGLAGGLASMWTSSANNKVAAANADAQNIVRKAQNQERAARTGLAATVRSINNQRTLTAAGDAQRAVTETLLRTADDFTNNRVEAGIRDMEQLGAVYARAASAGVGGGSVQALAYSIALSQARQEERDINQFGQVSYDLLMQRAGMARTAVESLDLSNDSAGLDYSVSTGKVSSGGDWTSLVTGLAGKASSIQLLLADWDARQKEKASPAVPPEVAQFKTQ